MDRVTPLLQLYPFVGGQEKLYPLRQERTVNTHGPENHKYNVLLLRNA